MKLVSIAILLSLTSATRLSQSNIWDSVAADVDDEYNKDAPKGYQEVKKPAPKIDYEAIARKKIQAEQKQKQLLAQSEENEKDNEEMLINLMTFSKTLDKPSLKKAMDLKAKLDERGFNVPHFRVSTYSLWQNGFKHETVKNYKFVKESMEDLLVAEKNLNRNIDSNA